MKHKTPDTPECADCLGLELVLSFGFADDEGALLTRDPVITRLPDGRWVVLEVPIRGVIRIYDPDGSFQRAVDARGEGPGEYRLRFDIFPKSTGGFVLYDPLNARLSQVDEDFSFLSSSPFHLQNIRMEALSSGSFVVNALLPSAAARGNVVHVVDSTGTVLASFGGSGRPIDLREGPHVRHRVIVVDHDDNIWTGYAEKYELEKYNAGGRLLRGDIFTSRYKLHSDTLASFPPPRTIFAFSPSKRLSPVTLVVFGVNALPGDEVAQALGSLDWQCAGSASELENLARRACCAVVAIPRLSDPGVLAWFVPLLKRYPHVGWVLLTSFSRGNASRLVDLPGLSDVVWFEEIHTALPPTVVRVLQADTLACLATAIEAAGELPQELRLGLALACTMPRPPPDSRGALQSVGY